MPTKISELPASVALDGTELVPVVQSSTTKRSTISAIWNYISPFLSASGGSDLIGFLAAGTGAVARVMQSKERDIVSVFDFMTAAQIADVQARTLLLDVTTAVQAALTAIGLTGGKLKAPAGSYSVSANLGLTSVTGVVISGDGMGATIIYDSRTDTAPYNPTGSYFGILSFINCTSCGIEDLTLHGAWVKTFVSSGNTGNGSRKGTYFSGTSPNCYTHRVEARNFRDEAIYADGNCAGWEVEDCYVPETNSNAINLNNGLITQSIGARIVNNYVAMTLGSPINVGGGGITVIGNLLSVGNTGQSAPQGVDIVTVVSAGRAVISDNIIFDSDTSSSSTNGIHIFGAADATDTAYYQITNNTLINILSDWRDGVSGGICINDADGAVTGTMVIRGNSIVGCGDTNANGRGIYISGSVSKVFIDGNTIRNKTGLHIDIGVKVDSTVAANAVVIGTNTFDNVSIPYQLNVASVEQLGTTASVAQVIAAVGNTILANADTAILSNTTGGSLTLTSAPTIADGVNGQKITLLNVGTQNIVIQDQGTLASSNLRLATAGVTLAPRQSVQLTYSTDVGDWVQSGLVVTVI